MLSDAMLVVCCVLFVLLSVVCRPVDNGQFLPFFVAARYVSLRVSGKICLNGSILLLINVQLLLCRTRANVLR